MFGRGKLTSCVVQCLKTLETTSNQRSLQILNKFSLNFSDSKNRLDVVCPYRERLTHRKLGIHKSLGFMCIALHGSNARRDPKLDSTLFYEYTTLFHYKKSNTQIKKKTIRG